MPFILIEERRIDEVAGTARLYRHEPSGARLLSVLNEDENKVFCASFRTPRADSTGIAHIMEHSVLCGSRKYRAKEPFIELSKSSLATFLNAMTYADKTCYPVASANAEDFRNLVEVYLDAVFHPLIAEETLLQEGWHYELDRESGRLSYKGVVFNEMKGSLSSPDRLFAERATEALFPDSIYGRNSGGDPEEIPRLDYPAFKAFHERHYHPANSWLYFYGDLPEEERLATLEPWLAEFGPPPAAWRPEDTRPAPQPRFAAPRAARSPFPADGLEAPKSYAGVSWLLPPADGAEERLGRGILSHALLSTPASPLRRALLESGLGEDLAGWGLDDEGLEPYFSAGLKGVAPGREEEVHTLVRSVLEGLVREGLDPETLRASMNTVEFALREKNTGSFPRGLAVGLAALSTWLYDGDPFEPLAFEAPLAAIKARLARGEPWFEAMIRRDLVENAHRVELALRPDAGEGARIEAREREALDKAARELGPEGLERVARVQAELEERQSRADPPEVLAAIPSLRLADLPRRGQDLPIEEEDRILRHDLFTGGILYLDLGFDLRGLDPELVPFVGIFGKLLLETGTARRDYVGLSQRIGAETGGIYPAWYGRRNRDGEGFQAWLFLRGKSLASKTPELLSILEEMLSSARLDNRERIAQIVLEEKAGLESSLVRSGAGYVNRRLRARYGGSEWAAEATAGVTQLLFLRSLEREIAEDWASVEARLRRLAEALLRGGRALANVTIEASAWPSVMPGIRAFLDRLPAGRGGPDRDWPAPALPAGEGLVVPSRVNFVGRSYALGDLLAPSGLRPGPGLVALASSYLGTTWLWDKVRVQGGAYGAYGAWDPNSRVLSFLSYRDPNLLGTLETFEAVPAFLEGLEIPPAELERAVVGAIGEIDAYLLPDAKGWLSMERRLTGYTDEARQVLREEVLGAKPADFRALGRALGAAFAAEAARPATVALGSAEALEGALAGRPGLLELAKIV